MKYVVKIYNTDGYMYSFESNCRDSLKHLKRNICTMCRVFNKKGYVVSASWYDDEKGWVSCNFS